MADLLEAFGTTLRDLAQALTPRGIDWAVTGAVAANSYRDETRTTSDIDVLLTLAGTPMADVEASLHALGWTTTSILPEGWLLRLAHPRGGRIDIVATLTDYELGALARARQVDMDGLAVKVMAVEDVIILKLIANRFRDIADIESILAAKPELDRDYLSRWFETFELGDRFRNIEDVGKGLKGPF